MLSTSVLKCIKAIYMTVFERKDIVYSNKE